MLKIFFAAVLTAATLQPSEIPASLKTQANEKLSFQAHGVGDQIYTCNGSGATFSWTLKAPDARLLDEQRHQVGTHVAGPTWQASDGSRVTGKPIARMPSPDPLSIPWLLLQAGGHEGKGMMTRVSAIQRLNTKGGTPPATGCDSSHPGAVVRVPYEADYFFYAPAETR